MNSLRRSFTVLRRVIKSREQLNLTFKVSCSTSANAEEGAPKEEEEIVNNIVIEKLNDDLITTIGINRPNKKNALDVITAKQLSEALDAFDNDEKSLVAVLHGCGGNFCSGFDLEEIAEYDGEKEEQLPHFGPLSTRCQTGLRKPIVASISGYAVGAGFELALMCDLRIMEETAVLGIFNRRFGVPMMLGGTIRLPALVGYSRAMDWILKGRAISPEEAKTAGLLSEVVTCGAGLGKAIMMAKSLTKFPQKSMLADRASAFHATFSADKFEEAIQFERDNSSHLLYEEGVKGAKQFVNGIGRHGSFKNLVDMTKTFKELDKELV